MILVLFETYPLCPAVVGSKVRPDLVARTLSIFRSSLIPDDSGCSSEVQDSLFGSHSKVLSLRENEISSCIPVFLHFGHLYWDS